MSGPEKWIGYLEHATTELLGVYAANTGKGGCTIFAEIIRRQTRRNLQGVPWCATFVFAALGCPRCLGPPHPGTRVLARRMRRRGLWRGPDYVPRPGDIIFCSNAATGRIGHCGIVEAVNGPVVVSIDGNTVDPSGRFKPEEGGAVARRAREMTDPVIAGYGAVAGLY